MRPVRLEFCGINSFSEPAEIDFRGLLEFGIFGIFGDTGSGKSTILDCIGFALYGNVFRLGQRSSSLADIINYKLDKAYVNFEFEIVFEGKRRVFRIEREVKRKNAIQSVRVYERRDGSLAALTEGVRESDALLRRIIGLEQKDFEKCIALPQGEFAQFVKSAPADRVKLIARLFDLERYGDRLKDRAREYFKSAKNEVDLCAARLEPYAGVTHADAVRQKEEIAALAEEEKTLLAQLFAAREEERRLAALAERRASSEKAKSAYAALLARREDMAQLERELSRLERAAEVVSLAEERDAAARRKNAAGEALLSARQKLARAEEEKKALSRTDEESEDAEIARLTGLVARAEELAVRIRRRAAAEQSLEKTAADYRAEAQQFSGFSYEEEREAIEKELSSLGEGDFLSFAEERGKDALFRKEYATFSGEIGSLAEKYPQIGPDAAPLIEKYTRLSEGEEGDYAAVRRAYDERERARKALQNRFRDLEIYRGKYELHLQRLQQLQTEFLRLKEELASYAPEEGESVAPQDLRARLEEKRRAKKERTGRRDRANAAFAEANAACAAASASADAAEQALTGAETRYRGACSRSGFESAEEARLLVKKFGKADEAREQLAAYRTQFAAAEARVREFDGEDFSGVEGDAPERAKRAAEEAETREREHGKALALRHDELKRTEEKLAAKRELEKIFAEKQREADIAERLKKLLDGNKFMEFVAEECLQNVAAGASARLLSLTGGRYFLRYDGGFLVGDNFNGGAPRGVYTLSGGETFLVSLSLALSLSAEICAKSLRPIEFFFLDEGFGTLDEHLVDVVLDSLEKLKSEHFSIGIISHVEELKHRIDKKLLVKKATEKHGSQIQAE